MSSQSNSAQIYKMNAGTATAGRIRSKGRKSRRGKSKSNQVVNRISHVNKRVAMIIAAVFMLVFMILAQNYIITKNDQSIISLREDLKTITEANDSKSGKILKMQDLSELEKKAVAYGMVKPEPDQYVYVVVDNPSTTPNTDTVQ